MIGLLGKKVGMTRIFDEEGKQVPVTVLECGPCHVTAIKSKEKDGYQAVQLAYENAKAKNVNKPETGHFKKAGVEPKRFVREIRSSANVEGLKLGAEIKVNQFEAGDIVDIEATSKGKGYQGVVKRHGFSGGENSHGSKFGRWPGGIGQSATPSRVMKGRKLPGQLGNENVTRQNVKVLEIDEDNNLIIVKGSVPGASGSYIVVKNSLKKGKEKNWLVPEEPVEAAEPVEQPENNESGSEEIQSAEGDKQEAPSGEQPEVKESQDSEK